MANSELNQEIPDDEINLLDYWRVIWKQKFIITGIVLATVLFTVIYSLSITDIYVSTAIIAPVGNEKGGGGGLSLLAQQFGGGLQGITLPGSPASSDIVNLLESNILREEVITRYNLLPILFPEQRDKKKMDRAPTMWDGLRSLNGIVNIKNSVKDNTITVSAEFHDPEIAANIVNHFLATLTDHMSNEAKRVAEVNKKYLEQQLIRTADPIIRQKIYGMIAQQVEMAMMAEVKENFAFKVIDPPRAPDMKIKPKRRSMVMISLVTSLFAGIFIAFFIQYIENVKRDSHINHKDKS